MGGNFTNNNLIGGESYRQLEKLKKLYDIILAKQSLILRSFISLKRNDLNISDVFFKLKEHIDNKIKVDDNGKIYVDVNNSIKFDPEKDPKKYDRWTKNVNRFIDLKEMIRQEIWSVALGNWNDDDKKTYLIDVEGKIDNEEKWNYIKGTKIKVQSFDKNNNILKILKKKDLYLLCKLLKTNRLIIYEDKFQLINKNFTWQFQNNFNEIQLFFTQINKSFEYLYNSCSFLRNKYYVNTKTQASGLNLWNLICLGFVPQTDLTNSFQQFVNQKFGSLANKIKFKKNIFSSYIDKEFIKNYNEDFLFKDFYLIGKEFCLSLKNVDIVFDDKSINDFDNIQNQYIVDSFLNEVNYSLMGLV